MNSPYNVIIRPIVTERSYDLMEQVFGVHVTKVNTLWISPKSKRQRYQYGLTRKWKKAVVTLAPGDSIEIFGDTSAE